MEIEAHVQPAPTPSSLDQSQPSPLIHTPQPSMDNTPPTDCNDVNESSLAFFLLLLVLLVKLVILSGSDNWEGLLDPLDSDLRRYLLHYAAMAAPTGEALITDPASRNIGLCRYARKNLLANTGAVKGNPFKYEVTKYFYAPSGASTGATGYTVRPARADAVLKESNWMGYVAVATDEGKVREEVARLVERYKDEKVSITVTGASLGASMATLNATDLAVNSFKPDIPVTAFLFASPKVGDQNFKNAFANQPNLRGLRITDVKDNVQTLPPFGLPVGELFPVIFYQDVGVGFMIESQKSEYLKSELTSVLGYHDPMLYMHGIDGFQGSEGGFQPHGDFDIAKVNKYQDALKDEYNIPAAWWNIKDTGMVQQDDGSYILDDHEPDEKF
nr:phospholipase A1-IIgamma-like [Ipomoea trifida]